MTDAASRPEALPSLEDSAVRALCQQVWAAWNQRDSAAFAALFDEAGEIIGFDGSPMHGRAEVEAQLGQIFAAHQTAAYVGKIRSVRFLAPGVALLHAVAGMVPPGQSDLNPAVNALQVLVAAKRADRWYIVSYQNTPAQFHGRPELAEQLTDELRQLL